MLIRTEMNKIEFRSGHTAYRRTQLVRGSERIEDRFSSIGVLQWHTKIFASQATPSENQCRVHVVCRINPQVYFLYEEHLLYRQFRSNVLEGSVVKLRKAIWKVILLALYRRLASRSNDVVHHEFSEQPLPFRFVAHLSDRFLTC